MKGDLLDQALRFHFQLDSEGRVTRAGPSLRLLIPHVVGARLVDLIDRDLLDIDTDATDIDVPSNQLMRLPFEKPFFRLRGELLPVGNGERFFAGSLDPDDVLRLNELGLVENDFPAGDLAIDFSMLRWSRDSQVKETREVLSRLRQSTAMSEILKTQARTDSLTGIANRLKFFEDLNEAMARAEPIAVLMIDVDRFKSVNDLHGHSAGDAVLIAVANHLVAETGSNGLVARIGGDEFGVLITSTPEAVDSDRLCEQLVGLNGSTLDIDGKRIGISLSAGRAVWVDEIDSGELMRHADIAMYAGRKLGYGQVSTFDPETQRNVDLRRSIASDLVAAIRNREIKMNFQPIVDLQTREAKGFEVLSRWVHPTHGAIPPGLFVEVAEHCGIVEELDNFVIGTAMAEARDHLCLDGELPMLSINVSALSLSSRLVGYLSHVLSDLDFPASKLCIEITETAAISEIARTAKSLHDIHALGVTVSLDDFGTGFSSLTYLHQLPIGELKVDRSFVADMLESRKALELVRSIVHVAHSLQLPVIAEGIETVEQSIVLKQLGCQLGQGYWFARPTSAVHAARGLGKQYPLAGVVVTDVSTATPEVSTS